MSNETKDQKEKLLELVRNALDNDKKLRETYQIGDKFRFIRDRLQALSTRVEESLATFQKEKTKIENTVSADEVLVYVYLYNAQGLNFSTWQKMLSPSVFYEYSINRPIYMDKANIEAFVRSRTNKAQHGYLTFAVKKENVLKVASSEEAKDAIGHPLIKVKEGALRPDRLIGFTHTGQDYETNAEGEIVKKKS